MKYILINIVMYVLILWHILDITVKEMQIYYKLVLKNGDVCVLKNLVNNMIYIIY